MDLRRVPDKIGRERLWKLVSWASGAPGAFLAQTLIKTIFKLIRKDKSTSAVFDSRSKRFSVPDAVVWAVAGGLGLGLAKILSARLAEIGWEAATGTRPPGSEERAVV